MTKNADNITYIAVMLEELHGKFDVLAEDIAGIHYKLDNEVATKAELAEVKEDIKAIKAAVTGTSAQVHGHEERINKLEAVHI